MIKTCKILWGGFTDGPTFVDGIGCSAAELHELNQLYKSSRYIQESSRSSYDETIDNLNQDMISFLNERGISVVYSDYASNWDSLLESPQKTTVQDLRGKMKTGIVKIRYFSAKDNKDIIRRGTLNNDLGGFPPKTEKIGRRHHRIPRSIFCYFDVDKKAWRSFRKTNFKKILDIEKKISPESSSK